VVTVEGLAPAGAGGAEPEPPAGLDPVQAEFVVAGAVQCGFCTPGLVVAVRDLLARSRLAASGQEAR
jgi:aerobic carbon-monoxide dehydrogenase small subunit